MTKNQSTELPKIIKRLELIRNLVALNEEEGVTEQVAKLKTFQLDAELTAIVERFDAREYGQGAKAIEAFITGKQRLTLYADPEIEGLKLEAKSLEQQLGALSNEKADLDKLLHEFVVRHTRELGELIQQILQYRREQARGTPQQEEAEKDYKAFSEDYEIYREEAVVELTEEEKKELKQKYRKASKYCHPDIVAEDQKELAGKLFSELSAAYEKSDLATVTEILRKLESGDIFTNKSESIAEKQKLKSEIEQLKKRIGELQAELSRTKASETYQTISSVISWDDYFSRTKVQLTEQLNQLRHG